MKKSSFAFLFGVTAIWNASGDAPRPRSVGSGHYDAHEVRQIISFITNEPWHDCLSLTFHVMEPTHKIFGLEMSWTQLRCSCWFPLRTLRLHKLYPLTPSTPCSWTFVAVKWKGMEHYPQFNIWQVTTMSSNASVWHFDKTVPCYAHFTGPITTDYSAKWRCHCVILCWRHSSISVRLLFNKKIIGRCT